MTHRTEDSDDSIYPPEMGPTPHGTSPPNEVNLRRATFARRVTLAMLALYLIGTLGLNTYAVVQIRTQQTANSPVLEKINDCTEPSGDCYKRGQKRTAEVLSDVSRIIILAAACAVDVTPADSVAQRQASITICIQQRIARDDR